MLKTSLDRLRLVGMLEGSSFLLLLGVAMPLKYMAGIEERHRGERDAHRHEALTEKTSPRTCTCIAGRPW